MIHDAERPTGPKISIPVPGSETTCFNADLQKCMDEIRAADEFEIFHTVLRRGWQYYDYTQVVLALETVVINSV